MTLILSRSDVLDLLSLPECIDMPPAILSP